MTRSITFCISLLLTAIMATAQKDEIVHLFPQQVIMKSVNFSETEVADLRKDTANIGHYNASVPRKEYILHTDHAFADALSVFGQKMIARTNIRQPEKLVIVVYEFFYGHKDEDQTYPALSFSADFFLGSDKNGYRLYKSLDMFHEYATAEHPDRDITGELNNIFGHIALDTISLTGNIYDRGQLALRRQHIKDSLAVYHQDPQKGIYLTFEEFRNNTPSIRDFSQKDHFNENGNEPEFVAQQEGKGKQHIDPKTAYAVYNGKRWYKSIGKTFVGMRFENDEFYCRCPMKGIKGKNFLDLSDWLAYEAGNENDYVAVSKRKAVMYDCQVDYCTGNIRPVKRMK
ncbi:hypothetical protein ACTHGU_07930 [Chitinophagaceae bacterium MMS25-I14]